jgi:hypothetical protein
MILASDRLAVGDLAGHLDPPSRLVLIRRLIREGLLESFPLSEEAPVRSSAQR